jgi:ABC-2 type transport system permease protein
LISLGGAAVLLLAAGVASGAVYGAQSEGLAVGLGTGVSAMAVQIPAVLVVGGLTVALTGWLPRQTAIAWALLAAFVLLGQLGRTLGLPQAMLDLSPFTHVPPLPTGTVGVTPVAVLLIIAGVSTGAGFLGFARRDVG